jgi:hypothetical protein
VGRRAEAVPRTTLGRSSPNTSARSGFASHCSHDQQAARGKDASRQRHAEVEAGSHVLEDSPAARGESSAHSAETCPVLAKSAYGDFGDDGQCGFCFPGRHCFSPGPGGSASAAGVKAPKTPTIESTAKARLILDMSHLPPSWRPSARPSSGSLHLLIATWALRSFEAARRRARSSSSRPPRRAHGGGPLSLRVGSAGRACADYTWS